MSKIDDAKKSYTDITSDLQEKYGTIIAEIKVIDEIDVTSIKALVEKIDAAMSQVYFDFAEAKSVYAEMAQRVKSQFAKKRIEAMGSVKGSADDRRAWAEDQLTQDGWYDAETSCRNRLTFMENVVTLLERKKELLNIDREVLRLESQVTQY